MIAITIRPVRVLKNEPDLVAWVVLAGVPGAVRSIRADAGVVVAITFAIDRVENEGESVGGPCDAAIAGANAETSRAATTPKPAARRKYTEQRR